MPNNSQWRWIRKNYRRTMIRAAEIEKERQEMIEKSKNRAAGLDILRKAGL